MSHLRFKICVFGDAGVGKTTLTQRYLTGIFHERYQLTIGTDFYFKKLKINDDDVSLQIWDFAGEEKFRFMMSGSLLGAQAAIFCYDITRYATLESINDWYSRFKEINQQNNQEVLSLVVGAKLDLEEFRTVPREHGLEMARNQNAVGWIECSSKSGNNIMDIFEGLTRIIIRTAVEKKKAKSLSLFP